MCRQIEEVKIASLPGARVATAFSLREVPHILEGEVTITEDNGAVHRFTDGDVFFVPKDTVCSRKSEVCLKK